MVYVPTTAPSFVALIIVSSDTTPFTTKRAGVVADGAIGTRLSPAVN